MSLVNSWRAALHSPRATPDYYARGTTMFVVSNGRWTRHVLTWCSSNYAFPKPPVVVPLPSSLGGLHHSHLLHCNPWLMILSASVFQNHWSCHWRISRSSFPVSVLTLLWFSVELLRTSCTIILKIFLTSLLILRISVLRRLDPRSSSYSSHPPLRNALGICCCTLELMSIPLNIALLTVYAKFHCAGCSFAPRSLPSTFQYTFTWFAKLPETLLHWW